MTHFERDFLASRPSKVMIRTFENEKGATVVDFSDILQNNKEDFRMQMNYRELDRLSKELENEIKAAKALRMELEKYKAQISVDVEDEATQKIEEVIKGIEKMFN